LSKKRCKLLIAKEKDYLKLLLKLLRYNFGMIHLALVMAVVTFNKDVQPIDEEDAALARGGCSA
jgi:hypothetical protein